MEFEVLHRSKKKQLIIAGVAVVLILVAIVIGITFARYRVSSSASLVYGEVNYSRADLDLVAVYLEREDEPGVYDNSIDVPPAGEYLLNSEKSTCSVSGETDASITIQYVDGKLNFLGLTKRGTKCHVYFDKIRDTQVPVISNVTSSVTQTSITVNVTASDNEGVAKYFYSINNGNYVESTSSSHTFNNLTAGTSYSIKIYVTDESGNESEVDTRNISTESDGDTMQTIIAGYNKGNRGSFSSVYTTTTTNTVFTTTDWKGTSYYFAGAPTDNWVRFGGFYWRIIRVNGDGSVRLIYNGTSTTTTGTGTMINNGANQKFNSGHNRSEYVGLKYTQGQQHGQTENSDILIELQSWYTSSNLDDYADYIDTSVGFCSDRNMASGYSWSSQPSSKINYAAYGRLDSNKSPSLACTTSDIITEPVGLITADEVAYAGGVGGQNNNGYYLYTNSNYWTMSPYSVNAGGYAYVFNVRPLGGLDGNGGVTIARGVRPVINLKANTKFQGSGTTSDPYVVV